MRKHALLAIAALGAALAAGIAARDWLTLAWHAWHYPVATASARTQIVFDAHHAYLAAGRDGLEAVDLVRQERQTLVAPTAPLDRIDDVASADGLLFALDATPPGFLQVYAPSANGRWTPSGAAIPVAVGPFSGVSAAAGVVAVSGGTSQLSLHEYDARGRLSAAVASADYGRGQPDIAMRGDGRLAVVSTHTFGPHFGLTFVQIQRQPLALHALGRLALPGAGFTAGGYKPAHFPLVCRWRGNRVYVAYGDGLAVVDAADPVHPRLLHRDPLPGPAMDIDISANDLFVARAGAYPALFRYRLDNADAPTQAATWRLPRGLRIGSLAQNQDRTWVALGEKGWRSVGSHEFSPATP